MNIWQIEIFYLYICLSDNNHRVSEKVEIQPQGCNVIAFCTIIVASVGAGVVLSSLQPVIMNNNINVSNVFFILRLFCFINHIVYYTLGKVVQEKKPNSTLCQMVVAQL